jgi:hypothetical protein
VVLILLYCATTANILLQMQCFDNPNQGYSTGNEDKILILSQVTLKDKVLVTFLREKKKIL